MLQQRKPYAVCAPPPSFRPLPRPTLTLRVLALPCPALWKNLPCPSLPSLHPDKYPILTCRPSKGLAENLPFWILLSLKCLLAGSLCRGVVPRAVMGAILYYFAIQTTERTICAAMYKVYKVVPRVVMGPADRPTPRSLVMNRPPAWERLERNGKSRKLKYLTAIFYVWYLILKINIKKFN